MDIVLDEVRIIPAKNWQSHTRKARIYTSTPIQFGWEPGGPECSDPACEGWTCKSAHGIRIVGAIGQMLGTFSMVDARKAIGGGWADDDRGDWLPRAETDHKVWQKARREALAAERALVVEAMPEIVAKAERELKRELSNGLGKFSFSNKAGCSCGCSPGWIATARGFDVSVSWIDADARKEEAA